ncbi:hypothetical protein Tco_0781778 [Tanacetum coccineum]
MWKDEEEINARRKEHADAVKEQWKKVVAIKILEKQWLPKKEHEYSEAKYESEVDDTERSHMIVCLFF